MGREKDDIWNEVLRHLIKDGQVRVVDLEPRDVDARRQIRRVFKEMEELGWLDRENADAANWTIGEKAELHLSVSRD